MISKSCPATALWVALYSSVPPLVRRTLKGPLAPFCILKTTLPSLPFPVQDGGTDLKLLKVGGTYEEVTVTTLGKVDFWLLATFTIVTVYVPALSVVNSCSFLPVTPISIGQVRPLGSPGTSSFTCNLVPTGPIVVGSVTLIFPSEAHCPGVVETLKLFKFSGVWAESPKTVITIKTIVRKNFLIMLYMLFWNNSITIL